MTERLDLDEIIEDVLDRNSIEDGEDGDGRLEWISENFTEDPDLVEVFLNDWVIPNLTIAKSPLTGKQYIAYIGKDGTALWKKEVE